MGWNQDAQDVERSSFSLIPKFCIYFGVMNFRFTHKSMQFSGVFKITQRSFLFKIFIMGKLQNSLISLLKWKLIQFRLNFVWHTKRNLRTANFTSLSNSLPHGSSHLCLKDLTSNHGLSIWFVPNFEILTVKSPIGNPFLLLGSTVLWLVEVLGLPF